MNILLIGSGGREHAIANALAKSPRLKQLFISPGNPGTAQVGANVSLDNGNHDAVRQFCQDRAVELVVIGPEQPLIDGLSDALAKAGIAVFGPSQAAAQLEGSKGFTKDLCRDNHIPTADYAAFDNEQEALAYLRTKSAPIVVKADGVAAGKGVVVAMTLEEAQQAVSAMFAGVFGAAGAQIVIEEFLSGEEASFFAICDGARAHPFATAQDHKRVGDGDTGPNTGGMGAYSPASIISPALSQQVMDKIIYPTLKAMQARGAPFSGILYAGLMLTKDGPKLIEYNVRFGDPEAQAILPRLDEDLAGLMFDCARGNLPIHPPQFTHNKTLTVVMAAQNYPDKPVTGTQIHKLEEAEKLADIIITHAGTRLENGQLVAAGGRVLNITASAPTIYEAQKKAYAAAQKIDWREGFYRHDIGWREVLREKV
jgi:phosphoribosylamine---glycine ligase